MKAEQTAPNGYRHLHPERSLGDEFQESVLPQITGLLSDAEAVLRSEARLIEAKFIERVERTQQKLIASILGVGALVLALGLFVVTIVNEVTTYFPDVPVWSVTGALSLITCLTGGFLLSGTPRPKESEGE